MTQTLSPQQTKLLAQARDLRPIVFTDGSTYDPGLLVSGHQYRTALSLEKRGLVRVRYQGPSLGWANPVRTEA
jgi:hypothetical protein